MQEAGLDIPTVNMVQLPSADAVTALRNGAVDVTIVAAGFESEIMDDHDFEFLFPTGPNGEPGSGLVRPRPYEAT